MSHSITKHYINESDAQIYSKNLNELRIKIEQGKQYKNGAFAQEFSSWVNENLQTAAIDKHLALISPSKYQDIIDTFYGGTLPEEHNQVSVQTASKEKSHHHHKTSKQKKEGQGLAAIGVLNVGEISRDGLNQTGYISFSRLDSSTKAKKFLGMVFNTFTESDQIIIDLRNCLGGDAEAVTFLSNYFYPKQTLVAVTERKNTITGEIDKVERWTTPNKLSEIYSKKPLTLLISSKTFSAAESFAFALKNSKTAKLLGQNSGGGGYTNDFFSLPHNFGVSISVGRTFDPLSGKGWQGTGVAPDKIVDTNHALYTALTNFTKSSGKLDKFNEDERQIYDVLQSYSNAWYQGNAEQMGKTLSVDFKGLYKSSTRSSNEEYGRNGLLLKTQSELGSNDNKLYFNRIIRDIKINQNLASATLILRKTKHKLRLKKKLDYWLVYAEVKEDKRRG